MNKVLLCRGGAPDKVNRFTSGNYELIKMDRTNLSSINKDELIKASEESNKFYVSAEEDDIKYINNLMLLDDSCVLLPRTKSGVIKYEDFVPKDSKFYEGLESYTSFIVPNYKVYEVDEARIINPTKLIKVAIKTTTGSGSRGVLIADPERTHLNEKTRSVISYHEYHKLVNYAEERNCKVMIQDLIPSDLLKVNCDFIIRDSELIGYMFTIVNQSQQFTNWDEGWIIDNDYIKSLMSKLTNYLTYLGITDGMLNFEAYSNCRTETWIVEMNWRLSNSSFQLECIGLDYIDCYLNSVPFNFPSESELTEDYESVNYEGYEHLKGSYFHRYWRCSLHKDIKNIKFKKSY